MPESLKDKSRSGYYIVDLIVIPLAGPGKCTVILIFYHPRPNLI